MRRYRKKPDIVAKLQQEIIERKHPLVGMANSFHDGVQLIDPYIKGFPILYVNNEFTNVTGYENNEVVGQKQSFLEGELTDKTASQKIIEAIEYEQSTTLEFLCYRKDSTPFWVEININALYTPEDILFAFVIIQKDITYKKETVPQNNTLLFDSTHGYTHSGNTNFITFINVDGYNKKLKADFPNLVKIEDDYYLNKHLTHFVIEEDVEKVMHSFKCALQGSIENIYVRVMHESHGIAELDLFYVPSYEKGNINGVLCIYKNITRHNHSTKLITFAEKYEAVKNTAFNIAEDLHYPLTALNGFTHLLQASNEGNQAYINLIQNEIKRIEQIKTGINLFARPHAVTYRRLNVQYLLEQANKALYAIIISHFIEIKLTYRASSKYIYGDKDKLTQVFILLLKNAIEASTSLNEGFIHIDVYDKSDAFIGIKIIDEGDGILEENLHKVTKPFYTTKKHGVGLGLTICKQIVQEHHGKFSVFSKYGKGTEVEVMLPIKNVGT